MKNIISSRACNLYKISEWDKYDDSYDMSAVCKIWKCNRKIPDFV